MMKLRSICLIAAMVTLTSPAHATTFSDAVATIERIFRDVAPAGPADSDYQDAAFFSYKVSDDSAYNNGAWLCRFLLSVPTKAPIGELIVKISESFTTAHGLGGNAPHRTVHSGENQPVPEPISGHKWDSFGSPLSYVIDTGGDGAPRPGDFFQKGGASR